MRSQLLFYQSQKPIKTVFFDLEKVRFHAKPSSAMAFVVDLGTHRQTHRRRVYSVAARSSRSCGRCSSSSSRRRGRVGHGQEENK